MRTLLALLAGLLLASPALAQNTLKGQLPQCTAALITAGTCTPSTPGAKAYATDLNLTMVYDEGTSTWVLSQGEGTAYQDFDFVDALEPETGTDASPDGSITVGCATEEDCDMSIAVNSGSDAEFVAVQIETSGTGATDVRLGGPAGGNYISVSEAGRMGGVGTGLIVATTDVVQICGENTTISGNIVFYGPNTTLVSNTSGFTCDINNVGAAGVLGGAEEAAQDAPAFTNKAVYVTGMTCRNEADSAASISYTLRTELGPTVPSVTCTIDGTGALTERDCVADIQTTTPIAAGATLAIAAASASDIADNNGFICNIQVTY